MSRASAGEIFKYLPPLFLRRAAVTEMIEREQGGGGGRGGKAFPTIAKTTKRRSFAMKEQMSPRDNAVSYQLRLKGTKCKEELVRDEIILANTRD